MKRTALARGAVRLTRRTPLARTSARLDRQPSDLTGDARKPAQDVPQRTTGRSGARDIPQQSRDAVAARSGGRCEICSQPATDWHHRQRRREGDHRPVNGLRLCREDHAWVHAHPKDARDAGWIVSAYSRPDTTPVLVRGRWVLLTEDGYQTDQRGWVA